MRHLAIGLNALLILALLYMLAKHGAPNHDEAWFVVVAFAAPVAALVAFFAGRYDSWLGLYFKRKALEEKQKIEALSRKKQS